MQNCIWREEGESHRIFDMLPAKLMSNDYTHNGIDGKNTLESQLFSIMSVAYCNPMAFITHRKALHQAKGNSSTHASGSTARRKTLHKLHNEGKPAGGTHKPSAPRIPCSPDVVIRQAKPPHLYEVAREVEENVDIHSGLNALRPTPDGVLRHALDG